jgi:hypothetical protein
MMMRPVFVALMLVAVGGSAAMAQASLSNEEKAACRSDAMKLCSAAVGKPAQMNACLRDNKAELSDACRKVVEAHGG